MIDYPVVHVKWKLLKGIQGVDFSVSVTIYQVKNYLKGVILNILQFDSISISVSGIDILQGFLCFEQTALNSSLQVHC